MYTDYNLLTTTFIYFSLGNILLFLFPGKIKKFHNASYYLAILHQGYILPFFAIQHLLGFNNNYRIIFTSTYSYFLADFFINRNIWLLDLKFVFHHLITMLLVSCTIFVNDEYMFLPTMNLLSLETGSLWISVTDIYPTNLNYKLRFYLYLSSRLITVPVTYLLIKSSGDLQNYWIILSILLYIHNMQIGYYMYTKLR